MRRNVREGERIPTGYGLAWYEDFAMVAVCYPIPLNWVAGWLRRLHWFLGRGPYDPLISAYQRGYVRGRDDAEWMRQLLIRQLER